MSTIFYGKMSYFYRSAMHYIVIISPNKLAVDQGRRLVGIHSYMCIPTLFNLCNIDMDSSV